MNTCHRIRVLSICEDDGLRRSRELLLRHEGYETVSASSSNVWKTIGDASFDVAILCQSMHHDKAIEIVTILRRINPEMRILRISPLDQSAQDCSYDIEYETLVKPVVLLNAISALQNDIRRYA